MTLTLLAALAIAVQATAEPYGTIAGTIRDEESGAPLAGVSVAVGGLTGFVISAADGRYEVRAAPAGLRQLTLHRLGYRSRTLRALVPAGGTVQINITLRATPLQLRPLLVRGRPFQAETIETAIVVQSSAGLWARPSLAEPDALAGLSSSEVVIAPEVPSGIHIRGGAADQTAFAIDGIPVLNPVHATGMFSAWNPDALESVTVSSGTRAHRLSGLVSATTRVPGERVTFQGGVSNTQARATVGGPLGILNAGLLLSIRTGFPGTMVPDREASYLRGESGDWLAKLDASTLGGRLSILGYGNENAVNTASRALGADATTMPQRNGFEWHSASLGAQWRRAVAGTDLWLLAWKATTSADAKWLAPAGRTRLRGERGDVGIEGRLGHLMMKGRSEVSLSVISSRTSYEVDGADEIMVRARARAPIVTTRAQHTMALGPQVGVEARASLAMTGGEIFAAPELHASWSPTGTLQVTLGLTRAHQFAQSLRNAESLAGGIFPVDLYLGAQHPSVPVARSEQAVLGVEYTPAPEGRLGVSAWTRRFNGLLLVAPRGGAPFAIDSFDVGAGSATGLAIDGTFATQRARWSANYGVQSVRIWNGDNTYVPGHGVTQMLQGGVSFSPRERLSLTLGATGAWGRRTTMATGGLEWESCSLLDEGCEFAGSPDHTGFGVGATPLPAYFRADLGVRKEWDAHIGGRAGAMAVFGTLTNLFARRNILTYMKDPVNGRLAAVEMRSRVPLVVGIDWRF